MRLRTLACLSLVLFCSVVFGWSNFDQEIFEVQHSLEELEGEGMDFYSYAGIDKKTRASQDEVSKAYRKKSLQMHPDKNQGVKGIHERFALLGVIASILRDSERKQRYDYFLKNGFPKWRGRNYLYERWRPGAVSTIVGIYLLLGVAHYGVLKLQAAQNIKSMSLNISEAQEAAWGTDRKAKSLSFGRKKVRVAATGRLFAVEPDGAVFLIDDEGQEWLLDIGPLSENVRWRNTCLGWPLALYGKFKTSNGHQNTSEEQMPAVEDVDGTAGSSEPNGTVHKSKHDTKRRKGKKDNQKNVA